MMSRLNIAIWALMFFVVCAAFLFFWADGKKKEHLWRAGENEILDGILSDFVLPFGREDFKNERVHEKRNLAYSVLTRIDPIFGLEGLDIEYLEKSVEGLKESMGRMERSDNVRVAPHALDYFNPVEFLASLPDLERARRSVVFSAAEEDIVQYHVLLSDSLDTYEREIDGLAGQYRAFDVYDGGPFRGERPVFTFLGSETDFETLISALEKLKANAKKQRERLLQRKECLKNGAVCAGLLGDYAEKFSAGFFDARWSSAADKDVGEEPELKIKDIERDFILNNGYERADKIFSLKTNCFEAEDDYFYLAWLNADKVRNTFGYSAEQLAGIKRIFRPFYLNDAYFEKIVHNTAFMSPVLKKGYRHYNISGTNYYRCPDLDYQARLLMMHDVSATIAEYPIRFVADKEFGDAQKKIIEGEILKERDVEKYFMLLAEYVFGRGERALLDDGVAASDILRAESLIAQFWQRSASFADLIANGVFFNEVIPRLAEINGSEMKIDPMYLFTTHSYPSLYFLSFNRSASHENVPFGRKIEEGELRGDGVLTVEGFYDTYGKKTLLDIFDVSRRLMEKK